MTSWRGKALARHMIGTVIDRGVDPMGEPCHRRRLTTLFAVLVPLAAVSACAMPKETDYSPTATSLGDMSVNQAKAVLASAKGTLCFSFAVCGAFNPSVTAIEVSDDGKNFVIVETDGDRSNTVPVQTNGIKVRLWEGLHSGLVVFRDDLYIAFDKSADAKRVADALMVIQQAPRREQNRAAFAVAAKAYREAAVKPVPGEDVRRFEVQAIDAVKQKRFADAANLYGQALAIAPWWPAGHHDRALVLAELGRNREAIDEMQDYLALAPHARDARAMQDQIYVWQGREAAGQTAPSGQGITWNPPPPSAPQQSSGGSLGGTAFQAITGGGK